MVPVSNGLKKRSVMWKYLGETQGLLKNNDYSAAARGVLNRMDLGAVNKLVFVAHGSSYNASLIASHWLGEFALVQSRSLTPMSFNYQISKSGKLYDPRETLVVGISQTGMSRGTIQAIEYAKSLGYPVLTITDIKDTPVAVAGDYYLNIGCGEEQSNAKTKGVSCTLVLLQKFALEMGLMRGVLSREKYDLISEEISSSIEEIDEIMDRAEKWVARSDFGLNMQDICFLGHGKNNGTILEGMLKLAETMCVPTVCTETEEFSHGLHRYIAHDSHLVITNTGELAGEEALKTYRFFKERIPNCLLINAVESPLKEPGVINIAERKYSEASLGIMIIFHILSIAIPEKNGLDPNAPSNNEYTSFVSTRVLTA